MLFEYCFELKDNSGRFDDDDVLECDYDDESVVSDGLDDFVVSDTHCSQNFVVVVGTLFGYMLNLLVVGKTKAGTVVENYLLVCKSMLTMMRR